MPSEWDWIFEAQYQSTDESQAEDQLEAENPNESQYDISDDEGNTQRATSGVPRAKRNAKPWVKRRPESGST